MFNFNRKSKHLQTYNKFTLALVDLCCDHDIHKLNGRLFVDREGNITCVANKDRSLVHYAIASIICLIHFHSFVFTIMIFLIISL